MCVNTHSTKQCWNQGSVHEGVLLNLAAEESCCLRGKGRPCGRQCSVLASEQYLTSVSASIAVKCCFYKHHHCCHSSEHPACTQHPAACGTELPFRTQRTCCMACL